MFFLNVMRWGITCPAGQSVKFLGTFTDRTGNCWSLVWVHHSINGHPSNARALLEIYIQESCFFEHDTFFFAPATMILIVVRGNLCKKVHAPPINFRFCFPTCALNMFFNLLLSFFIGFCVFVNSFTVVFLLAEVFRNSALFLIDTSWVSGFGRQASPLPPCGSWCG